MSTDGWGGGLSAIAPGVSEDLQAQVRASAWRLVAHAETCAPLAKRLHVDFAVTTTADPYAQAARLARLLRQLIHTELPRLRRSIRCEAHPSRRRSAVPGGGRIDVAHTWRARQRTRAPVFSIKTTQRIAHTPVNQVLATHLNALESMLLRLKGTPLLPEEAHACSIARTAVRRFMTHSPLALIPPLTQAALPRVRQAARRRRAEWRRVRGFLQWWQALARIEVDTLRDANDEALAAGAPFELAACAGIICAWHTAIEAGRDAPPGLTLTLERSAGRWALRVLHDDGDLMIHARDLNVDAAQDLARFMRPGHVLITPGEHSSTHPWMTVAAPRLGELAVWSPVLDRLDALLEAA